MNMRSYREIIDAFNSKTILANMLGVKRGRVSHWYMRDNIPADYFKRIVKCANDNGISHISINLLCDIADRKCIEKQKSQSK